MNAQLAAALSRPTPRERLRALDELYAALGAELDQVDAELRAQEPASPAFLLSLCR